MTQASTKRGPARALLFVLVVALLVVAGMAALAVMPSKTREFSQALPDNDPAALAKLVEAGRYVATSADCVACHTAPGARPFAGGLPLASPIGTLYSTNITPDQAHGIGSYTLAEFDRALRHGIARDGHTLYPAMPYPSYSKLTDQDTLALYAYFMKSVEPVEAANRASDIPWPLSMRWPLALWRKTFAPDPMQAPAGPDLARYGNEKIARGAYLVQGAGHCGSCHTPRATTLQEKALDDADPLYLAGGQVIDGWLAGSLRGNPADGLGRWSEADIAATLKTARNAHAAVVGSPMQDVVLHSTQHMTDDDLGAMAAYLKTLAPSSHVAARFEPNGKTAELLRSGQETGRGAQVYADSCAACHRSDGKGYAKAFPALAGNPTVLAEDPTSLVRLILAGASLPSTKERPSNLGMPGFQDRLDDDEVARLATFVRSGWGNDAPAVNASLVAEVRRHLKESVTAQR